MFGESTINAIVSLTSFEAFLSVHHRFQSLSGRLVWIFVESFLSILLGYATGLVAALVCKYKHQARASAPQPDCTAAEPGALGDAEASSISTEFGAIILFPWISYLTSEALSLTPMMSIYACSISLGQFALKNLSKSAATVRGTHADRRAHLPDDFRRLPVDLLHLHGSCLHGVRCASRVASS